MCICTEIIFFSFNHIVWKGINIVPRESIYKLIMYVECLITLVIFFFYNLVPETQTRGSNVLLLPSLLLQ